MKLKKEHQNLKQSHRTWLNPSRMKNKFHFIIALLFCVQPAFSNNLDYKIQGHATDKAELESFAPSPDIPSVQSLLFSLDGGKAAMDSEVIPLALKDAAHMSDLTNAPLPTLPLIPSAPFIVQALPIGDKFDVRRNAIFGEESSESILEWEFRVIDEDNNEIYVQTSSGRPPNPLMWDGKIDDQFVLKPDLNYQSSLVVRSSSGTLGTWPGEAVRFISMSHFRDQDLVIDFGYRVYDKRQFNISPGGEIFLDDLTRRLYGHRGDWTIEIPKERHRAIWMRYLKKELDKNIEPEKIIVIEEADENFGARFILHEYKGPPEPEMRGRPSPPRPLLEKMDKWVTQEKHRKTLVVGLRHDRLFSVGSAYLRDQAIPHIVKALNDLEKEKKKEEPNTIVLRSYLERVYDRKKLKNEVDPELAALRSKVLFMLFARSRFTD